jgi:Domain of unknown function (DUF4368)
MLYRSLSQKISQNRIMMILNLCSLEQLKTFLNFNTLTTEMLLRFIEKIEVTENRLRGYNPPQSFIKTNCEIHSTCAV